MNHFFWQNANIELNQIGYRTHCMYWIPSTRAIFRWIHRNWVELSLLNSIFDPEPKLNNEKKYLTYLKLLCFLFVLFLKEEVVVWSTNFLVDVFLLPTDLTEMTTRMPSRNRFSQHRQSLIPQRSSKQSSPTPQLWWTNNSVFKYY